jgi:hypothetical protein
MSTATATATQTQDELILSLIEQRDKATTRADQLQAYAEGLSLALKGLIDQYTAGMISISNAARVANEVCDSLVQARGKLQEGVARASESISRLAAGRGNGAHGSAPSPAGSGGPTPLVITGPGGDFTHHINPN